jgi:hypothetical protein
MPVNVTQLRQQIDHFAQANSAAIQARAGLIETLRAALLPGVDSDALLASALTAMRAVEAKRHWSGALFGGDEAISMTAPFGVEPDAYALIASDGSQIMPDRHKPFLFAYVQAACACIVYGHADNAAAHAAADALQRKKPSRLLSDQDLDAGEDRNPAAEVSNLRDVLEIELLAEACQAMAATGVRPVVIADGSIVPFALLNERTLSNAQQVERLLKPVMRALDIMRETGALVAGYIDRPNSNAVVKTCALLDLPAEHVTEAALIDREQRFAGIFDRHVISTVLPAQRRTALFDPNWRVNGAQFLGRHAMRACYVNFGSAIGEQAVLARLEVPQWCAAPEAIATLTGILRRQAALSADPYPFILKAAHEEAVVGKDDQREIETALEQALLARGVRVRYSPKQAAKDSR